MMVSDELKLLAEINRKFQIVIEDMNNVVKDLATLSEIVYDNKMFQMEKESNEQIKLYSHM